MSLIVRLSDYLYITKININENFKKDIVVGITLMLVNHCHKPVFTPKMAIFRRAGIREGGLPCWGWSENLLGQAVV